MLLRSCPHALDTTHALIYVHMCAQVVLAVPRAGRDGLPTTHIAVRHDLMHPTMPAAAVAKLRARLQASLGDLVE